MWSPFKNRVRRVTVALVTVVAGAGIALAFVAPAQAATTPGMVTVAVSSPANAAAPAAEPGCGSGELCVWVNTNFGGGTPGQFADTNNNWLQFSHPTCQTKTWSDCASSLENNDTVDAETVFKNINFGGDSRCLPLGTTFSNLTTVDYTTGAKSVMNDSISSNQLTGECG